MPNDDKMEKKRLKAVLDRFEGETAIIIFADNQKINIPKDFLGKDVKEGSAINITFSSDLDEETNKRELARSLLNEILNKGNEA